MFIEEIKEVFIVAKKRANGEGSIRQRKDGRWEGLYSINNKRKSVYGKTQEEVRKKLNKVLNDIDSGIYIEDCRITMGEWLYTWLYDYKKNTVKQKTFEGYEALVNKHLIPAFSKIQLKKLSVDNVQRFINQKISEGLSSRTIRYINTLLHSALKQAINNGLIVRNVAEAVTLPERKQKDRKFLTAEEQERFIKCLSDEKSGFVLLFALSTGLRRGELLALRWSNYDNQKKYITVTESLSRLKGADGKSHLTFTTPKTASSKRTIPILPDIANKLNVHRQQQAVNRLKAGQMWEDNDLIFCTDFGKPLEPRNLFRILGRVCDKAEIAHINIHALRHAFATRALENGIPLKVVSDMLGHSSIALTADIYSHVSVETMENELQKLSNAF